MMTIEVFKTLAEAQAEDYELINCPVVIDASNYFYQIFKDSGLRFLFGCECDKFADYVRDRLRMFQEANVTCYFVFGGSLDEVRLDMDKDTETSKNIDFDAMGNEIFEPIFTQEVCKQVLEQTGIKYTESIAEFEMQCIALARELDCPIISNNTVFCFSNAPYIYCDSLSQNETNSSIKCSVFRLNTLLSKYSLTREKLILFILLNDETLFNDDSFYGFFEYSKTPLWQVDRSTCLLQWLSTQPARNNIIDIVFRFINEDEQKIFLEKEEDLQYFADPRIPIGVTAKFLVSDNNHNGTTSQQMPAQYINLLRHNILKYNRVVQDPDSRNAFYTALDIIIYAYSLISYEANKEFTIFSHHGDFSVVKIDNTIDWTLDIVKDKKLLTNIFSDKSYDSISNFVLEDAELLFVALSYCATKSKHFTENEAFSVFLSYVVLNFASDTSFAEDCFILNPQKLQADKPAGQLGITSMDTLITTAVMCKYLEITDAELGEIFDRKILHPLIEFQYCLQQFNFLNTLCGEPYKPTAYSKTFNATFVYRVLFEIKKHFNGSYTQFLWDNLKCAPTVAAYVLDTVSFWKDFQGEKSDEYKNDLV